MSNYSYTPYSAAAIPGLETQYQRGQFEKYVLGIRRKINSGEIDPEMGERLISQAHADRGENRVREGGIDTIQL